MNNEDLFNGKKASSNNKIYLWQRIAYPIQEFGYGRIPVEAEGRIRKIIEEYDPINNKVLRPARDSEQKDQTLKGRRLVISDWRLPIPGTVITKESKDDNIQVLFIRFKATAILGSLLFHTTGIKTLPL